jgi:hypothetical protein
MPYQIDNSTILDVDTLKSRLAIGYNTLNLNTSTGTRNTACGCGSLQSDTDGEKNTAVGFCALAMNASGSYNTAVGYNALSLSTGNNYNTAIGTNAQTYGNSNTVIGYNAASAAGTSNNCVITAGSVTASFTSASTSWSFNSDARDKTAIEDLMLGLDLITKLRPRKYQWDFRHTDAAKGTPAVGFIAQEILALVEETGTQYTGLVDTTNENQFSVAQTNLIPILVNAIKELTARLEILEGKNQII